ncbi:receptor-transporting protein 4-like [Paramormyrops kingsleyae]|uniref:receptor-transporting protein 4-like n=1 Tax=Paramormyrops kingsleyae TaxID=1676925 RepID=UPI000CD66D8C|nr:receptor-transporting protein 4-like [Paramormyrops kingsleyae]
MATDWTPALWSDTFAELEEDELEHGDSWTLNFRFSWTETLTVAERKKGWKIYCHRAQGGFRCSKCFQCWASDEAEVLFRYRLQSLACRGTIIMKPNCQTCSHCRGDSNWPGFSLEEVQKALHHLFNVIKNNCYGSVQ